MNARSISQSPPLAQRSASSTDPAREQPDIRDLAAVVGRLGIFMLGMKYMSEGSPVMNNRFVATAVARV